MKQGFRPLFVVPAVPNENGIRFLHPSRQIDVGSMSDEIWFLMSESNGYQTLETIKTKAKQANETLDDELVEEIFSDLVSLGIVVDSRQAYRHFHALANNPMDFYADDAHDADSDAKTLLKGNGIQYTQIPMHDLRRLFGEQDNDARFSDYLLTVSEIGSLLSISTLFNGNPATFASGQLKYYVIVTRPSKELEAGYYEFDATNGVLTLSSLEIDTSHLEYIFNSDTLIDGAPVLIVIAADLASYADRYANRGYRLGLLEAGHVAQKLYVAAREIGLSSTESASFQDVALANELGMDTERVLPILAVAIGSRHSNAPIFDSTKLLEKLEAEIVGPNKPVRYVREVTGVTPDKSESFYSATALSRPNKGKDAKLSYFERFSAGTATSVSLAKVKALAEAYERFVSGEIRVDHVGLANELQQRWVDPRKVVPYSAQQFERLHWLKEFNPDDSFEWVKGATPYGESVWVPVDLVFYPLSPTSFNRPLCYEANSSGVAAFTDRQEAVHRGLLELIERDAIMRNWILRSPSPKILYKALPHHWQRRIDFWEERGRQVYVLDQSAYGVTTINVVIASPELFPCFVTGSAASVTSFEEAIAKAFHEAELGLTYALQQPKHRTIDPSKVFAPLDHAKLYAHPEHFENVAWMIEGNSVSLPTEPTARMADLLEKFDVVIVDLSPAGSPLPVVRVLSEKLIPINFGEGSEHYTHSSLKQDDVDLTRLILPHYFA